jgi:hypothetical protein
MRMFAVTVEMAAFNASFGHKEVQFIERRTSYVNSIRINHNLPYVISEKCKKCRVATNATAELRGTKLTPESVPLGNYPGGTVVEPISSAAYVCGVMPRCYLEGATFSLERPSAILRIYFN